MKLKTLPQFEALFGPSMYDHPDAHTSADLMKEVIRQRCQPSRCVSIADELSDKARKRGLTAEKLEELLRAG